MRVERCAQAWIEEVHDVGFAGVASQSPPRRCRIPTAIGSIAELAGVATKLIFASTVQHSATHTEALDLYGLVPGVPAMMRAPPATRRGVVTRDVLARTLPDQFPDAYYGSLATVLQIHRPEEVRAILMLAVKVGNSLKQTVHTHRASVHQAAKLVAALLRVAK